MKIGNIDLAYAWKQAILSGGFSYEIIASEDDLKGRWKKNDLLGLSLQVSAEGNFGFQVTNIKTNKRYNLALHERDLDQGFVIRYNEARALKPGGSRLLKVGRQLDVSPNPDECRFNCQRPELPQSIYNHNLLGTINNPGLHHIWHIYANSFPTQISGQLLWLPVQIKNKKAILPHLAQEWTQKLLEDFLSLKKISQGMAFLWNSYPGGGASVRHFHFHSVALGNSRAIERAKPNAKITEKGHLIANYPANGIMWQQGVCADELLAYNLKFSEAGYPPNIIFIKGNFYMFPRVPDHEVVEEFPSGVLAGNELTGDITTSNLKVYQTLTLEKVQSAFAKITLAPKVILKILLS